MLAAAAGSAQADTTITCEPCSRPYQRWVDEARVPTPDMMLAVIEAPCPYLTEVGACTAAGTDTIWFSTSRRQVFYHELGHNFDWYVLPEWARVRYLAILDLAGPWEQPEAGHQSPNELFAESYAFCAMQPVTHGGGVAGQVPVGGWRVHNRVCRLIGRL
jgi:hypothetical protein